MVEEIKRMKYVLVAVMTTEAPKNFTEWLTKTRREYADKLGTEKILLLAV